MNSQADADLLASQKRGLLYRTMIVAVLMVGFGLRIHQLGHDSYWNDEAGQVLAASQPSLERLFAIERSHAMAMPLDYLVSRAFSHIGLLETIMRYPAVIWGTLTLATFFALVKRMTGARTALIATFLLAISGWHVHYSQEARFYSALVFFHTLATCRLFLAIDKHSLLNWAAFVLTCVIGTYFHPYVLLSVTSGLFYLFMAHSEGYRMRTLLAWTASTTLIVALCLPGYLYFGSHQQFNYSLTQWSDSLAREIAQGIGWMNIPYTPTVSPLGPWNILIGGFALIGLVPVIGKRIAQPLSLLLSIPLQIGLIVLGVWWKGYWLSGRQLVHLHAISLMFTAVGVVTITEFLSNLIAAVRRRSKAVVHNRAILSLLLLAAIGSLFVLSGAQMLHEYYSWPKSTARHVTAALMQDYCSGDVILVIPGYEEKVYRLYLQLSEANQELLDALQPTSWNDLGQITPQLQPTDCLIAPAFLTGDQETRLQALGFVRLLNSEFAWHGASTLYGRETLN